MIRVIVLTVFVLALAGSPAYLMDKLVMPELFELKSVYGNIEEAAGVAEVAGSNRH